MASFGDLPTEVAQKCVEFLEFGHLKGSVTEVKSVSRGLRRAARWALTRGRWRPIRFVSEHGLSTLKNLRGGLNSLDDGVAATFRAAWALDPGLVMRVIHEDMVDDYHGDAFQAVFLAFVEPSNVPGRIPRVRGPGDALYASHCDRASVVGQLARPRQGALLCGRGGANSAGMGQQVPRYQLPEAHT